MKYTRVFISGISSGLGRALAELILESGGTVYGISRRGVDDLQERYGERLGFVSVDLADENRSKAKIADLLTGVSALDLVILNAGVLGRIEDMRAADLEEMRQTMEINLWANKWLLDLLLSTVPSISQVVAISSGASVSGKRGWNGYGISKAALNMLIKLYAAEVTSVHFSALAPGLVDTAMQDYITGLPTDARFETVERLKAAKGTPTMPTAREAARRCLEVRPRLFDFESGSYVDIRKL